MKKTAVVCAAIALLFPSILQTQSKKMELSKATKNIFDFTVNTIDGKPRQLSAYKGKVLLIVNTASECGNTPQYKTLQELYEIYKDKGLSILAFPANNFGEQEPGTNSEIKTFCAMQYHTTFDLFEKISVKGGDQHPLYSYITKDSPFTGDVKWNFQKYLVDQSGNVVARYLSKVDPMSKEITNDIDKLLKK